jgi:hypothetical protein
MSLFWSAAAVALTAAVAAVVRSGRWRADRVAKLFVGAGLLMCVGPVTVHPILGDRHRDKRGLRPFLSTIVWANANDQPIGINTAPKVPELAPFTTRSGLRLSVPTAGVGQCIDAPLPCTPNPANNLRLRKPGDISSGFAVDGEWEMQRWPYDWQSNFLPALRTLERR